MLCSYSDKSQDENSESVSDKLACLSPLKLALDLTFLILFLSLSDMFIFLKLINLLEISNFPIFFDEFSNDSIKPSLRFEAIVGVS